MNQPDDKPIAFEAYQLLAERYAAKIDTKPHNAYLERPAMLSLLPDVRGLRVFDAGCGTGFYAAWLLDRGAEVVGVDVSPAMLDFARQRTGDRADLRLADIRQPLDFLPDASFDLVYSSLVMHYLEKWDVPFREFARVLKPSGLFIFSTGHPFAEYLMEGAQEYFAVEKMGMFWRGFGGEPVYVPFYRRPLGAITGELSRAGFVIEQVIETLPTEEFRQADPKDYEKALHTPIFICFRARKTAESPEGE